MYAQLVKGKTAPERRAEMDRIVREDLLPALREEPGFSGALNLVDRGRGGALMLVLWETEEQATREPNQRGARVREALAAVDRASSGRRRLSVWEVNLRV